jgi:hypothetical protein
MKVKHNIYLEAFDLLTMSWVDKKDIQDWQAWIRFQEEYCRDKATTFDWVGHLDYDDFLVLPWSHPFHLWKRRCNSYIKFFTQRDEGIQVEFKIKDAMMSKKKIQDFLYTVAISSKQFCYEEKPLSFWDTEVTGIKGGGFSEINWPQ